MLGVLEYFINIWILSLKKAFSIALSRGLQIRTRIMSWLCQFQGMDFVRILLKEACYRQTYVCYYGNIYWHRTVDGHQVTNKNLAVEYVHRRLVIHSLNPKTSFAPKSCFVMVNLLNYEILALFAMYYQNVDAYFDSSR